LPYILRPMSGRSGRTDEPQSALDVAAALLEVRPGLDQMQLHKLLYLVQAAHLAWFGSRAYGEAIEAWIYGPVTRQVAGHYMQFGDLPITRVGVGSPARLPERLRWLIAQVAERFGGMDGFKLAELVKEPGSPWRQARGDLADDAPSDAEIRPDVIADYHRRFGFGETSDPTPRQNELAQRFFDGDTDALAELFGATVL